MKIIYPVSLILLHGTNVLGQVFTDPIKNKPGSSTESVTSLTFRLGTVCLPLPDDATTCTNSHFLNSVCDLAGGGKVKCECDFLSYVNIVKPINCGWRGVTPDPTDPPPTDAPTVAPTDAPTDAPTQAPVTGCDESFVAPENGGIHCDNDDAGTRWCQMSCDDGFVPEELLTNEVVETKTYCINDSWSKMLPSSCVPALGACEYDTSSASADPFMTVAQSESDPDSLTSVLITLTCDDGYAMSKTSDQIETVTCDCHKSATGHYYCNRSCTKVDFGKCIPETECYHNHEEDFGEFLSLLTSDEKKLNDILHVKRSAFSSFMLSLFDVFLDKKHADAWVSGVDGCDDCDSDAVMPDED